MGSISGRTSAKEVLEQAEQAFDEPYTNLNNGQHEQIKGVYIISPYDTPVSAIESCNRGWPGRVVRSNFVAEHG